LTTPLVTNAGTLALSATGANIITAATNGVERLRVTSGGDVGIGTSPVFESGSGLEVERASGNSTLRLQRTGTSPSSMELRSGASRGEIFVTSDSPLLFATNNTERMRIDSAGNVGIGVTAPATKLEVSGNSGVAAGGSTPIAIRIGALDQDAGAGTWNTSADFAQLQFYSQDASIPGGANVRYSVGSVMESVTGATTALAFRSYAGGTPTERMRITSSGNVGIGTSAPLTILDVKNATNEHVVVSGSATYGNNAIVGVNDAGSEVGLGIAGSPIEFYTAATERMRITSAGNVGIGTSSPASRLHVVGGDIAVDFVSRKIGYITDAVPANTGYITPYDANGFVSVHSNFSSGGIKFHTGTSNLERLRITSAGNVGIGTSSPSARLHVFDSTAASNTESVGLILGRDGAGNGNKSTAILFDIGGGGGGAARIYTERLGGFGGNLIFAAGDTSGNTPERARIDASGNLLVGTTSSAGILTISGDQTYFTTSSTTNASLTLRKGAAGADGVDFLQCRDSANNAEFIIQGDGDAQNTNNSYGAISDAKLKENVTDATPKLDKLNQVRVVNYNLIGHERKQIGVIAQELEQIFPSMVQDVIDRDAEGNDLGTTTKSVKYSVFVPMLIKAMQEQQAIIKALEARVAALEA
jgi:hypothetical protein